jgi:hypothetical protein
VDRKREVQASDGIWPSTPGSGGIIHESPQCDARKNPYGPVSLHQRRYFANYGKLAAQQRAAKVPHVDSSPARMSLQLRPVSSHP